MSTVVAQNTIIVTVKIVSDPEMKPWGDDGSNKERLCFRGIANQDYRKPANYLVEVEDEKQAREYLPKLSRGMEVTVTGEPIHAFFKESLKIIIKASEIEW